MPVQKYMFMAMRMLPSIAPRKMPMPLSTKKSTNSRLYVVPPRCRKVQNRLPR
jgi:hypothetical protein